MCNGVVIAMWHLHTDTVEVVAVVAKAFSTPSLYLEDQNWVLQNFTNTHNQLQRWKVAVAKKKLQHLLLHICVKAWEVGVELDLATPTIVYWIFLSGMFRACIVNIWTKNLTVCWINQVYYNCVRYWRSLLHLFPLLVMLYHLDICFCIRIYLHLSHKIISMVTFRLWSMALCFYIGTQPAFKTYTNK